MAKTQEELNIIKKEVETLNKKLSALTEEELKQVIGGFGPSGDPLDPLDGEHSWCDECKSFVHVSAGPIIDGHPFLVCDNCGALIRSGGPS